jgi:cytochrome c
VIDLYTLGLGDHTFTVNAVDKAGNASTKSVTFSIIATVDSLKTAVDRFYKDGSIKNKGIYKDLMDELADASTSTDPEHVSEALRDFIHEVMDGKGRHITAQAADLLITDANWVIVNLPDASAPSIRIQSPHDESYLRNQTLRLEFYATDKITGVKEVTATLDGVAVTNGQKINLYKLALGSHTLTVNAVDYGGNTATKSVTFKVIASIHSLKGSVDYFYKAGDIDTRNLANDLMGKLDKAERSHKASEIVKALNSFIAKVQQESGNHIKIDAANQLIADAQWVIAHP